jgi:hypothetical protein
VSPALAPSKRAFRPRSARTWRAVAAVAAVATAAAAAGGLALGPRDAEAQRIDPRRPAVLVVGSPPGASPMHRVDARRTGLSKAPLPSGALRVAWRKATGLSIEQPALSGGDGTLAVISARGDVTFLDAAGEERGMVKVGATQVGPAAMTSDGTVVFATSTGDVVGVRRSLARVRFTTRIGGERNVRAAPLALDDGGVVIATMTDLVVLDAEGNVRSRTSLPEAPAAPLLASADKVLAVTSSGAVFGWAPGREPVRLASFGTRVDGGAVLVDGSKLLGVVEGNELVEIDLLRGARSTRSLALQSVYLGPPAARSTGKGPSLATLLALTPTRQFVVTVDPAGQELVRAPIASLTPTVLPDGGTAPLVGISSVGPLVDERGAVAFASTDGHVGVVSPEGGVETIGEALCSKSMRFGIVGLTPFGDGAFVVTCEGGVVLAIASASAALRRPVPPGSSAGPDVHRPDPRDPDED